MLDSASMGLNQLYNPILSHSFSLSLSVFMPFILLSFLSILQPPSCSLWMAWMRTTSGKIFRVWASGTSVCIMRTTLEACSYPHPWDSSALETKACLQLQSKRWMLLCGPGVPKSDSFLWPSPSTPLALSSSASPFNRQAAAAGNYRGRQRIAPFCDDVRRTESGGGGGGGGRKGGVWRKEALVLTTCFNVLLVARAASC